jgi:hypothetical protein
MLSHLKARCTFSERREPNRRRRLAAMAQAGHRSAAQEKKLGDSYRYKGGLPLGP